MKRIKRIMAGLMAAAALTVSMTSISASATEFYGYYQTPAMTAGQWAKTPTISIAGSSNTISSGDFGVWWYGGGVGLDTRFVRSNSRTVNIEIYEADAGGQDILTKRQTAYFTTGNDGYYTVSNFTDQWIVNNMVVENDSIAEVYMKLKVNTVSGDTSKNIPSGLMVYGYWID